MAQVLKEEIFERIFEAGVDVFYEKDFRSAKMKEIAERAHIPVGLIYSYFKNKEELFSKIVTTIPLDFDRLIAEEESAEGLPSERYKDVSEQYLLELLEHHKILVILMDKSQGTEFEDSKAKMITGLENHIKKALSKKIDHPYYGLLYHILANNFAESILEVARHYESKELAQSMLDLVTKCYYEGVDSL